MKVIPQATLSASGQLKVFLLILAFAIVGGTLWYTYQIVESLHKREREVADLYARSLEYVANGKVGEGDYNFVFSEIITKAIDFPIVQTDRTDTQVQGFKNIQVDSSRPQAHIDAQLLVLATQYDEIHNPILVTYQDTIILSRIHYGESTLITRLRWLPYIELGLVGLFILIGYISFSYIKRSEQSNIWVGMARETAHQLGTPISSLMGWVELVREQTASDAYASETLKEMHNDLLRLQKIAERFSKIGSRPDVKEENVSDVIAKVVQYFQRRIPHTGKKVQLIIQPHTPVHVRINRELFEWVVENLTKNALDAIESGEGKITYEVFERDGHVFVDVSDTGKGIDPKHRNDVFRPGFSTKKRGWGLGLSLAKRIVESYHAGKLTVKQSQVGIGTTFRIKLKK